MRKLHPIGMCCKTYYFSFIFLFSFHSFHKVRYLQIATELICTITTWLLLLSCMSGVCPMLNHTNIPFFINKWAMRVNVLCAAKASVASTVVTAPSTNTAMANIYFSLFLRTGLKKVHGVLFGRRSFYRLPRPWHQDTHSLNRTCFGRTCWTAILFLMIVLHFPINDWSAVYSVVACCVCVYEDAACKFRCATHVNTHHNHCQTSEMMSGLFKRSWRWNNNAKWMIFSMVERQSNEYREEMHLIEYAVSQRRNKCSVKFVSYAVATRSSNAWMPLDVEVWYICCVQTSARLNRRCIRPTTTTTRHAESKLHFDLSLFII